jgi:hypothetical protein
MGVTMNDLCEGKSMHDFKQITTSVEAIEIFTRLAYIDGYLNEYLYSSHDMDNDFGIDDNVSEIRSRLAKLSTEILSLHTMSLEQISNLKKQVEELLEGLQTALAPIVQKYPSNILGFLFDDTASIECDLHLVLTGEDAGTRLERQMREFE